MQVGPRTSVRIALQKVVDQGVSQGFYDVANEGGRASMAELTTGVEIFVPDFNTKSLYVIP